MPRVDKGFSTLEALAAMGIFAVVMLGIGSLPITVIQANLRARHVTAATNLARDKIEELRHGGYSSLAAGSDGALLTESSDQGGTTAYYSRSWAISSSSSIPFGKEVTVSVGWTDSSAHTVTLTTVVADTD